MFYFGTLLDIEQTMRGPAVIYVGNLPTDIKERELQEIFEKVI